MLIVQGLISTFFEVLSLFEQNEIPYMVVGSMASMIYGEPRMTNDMDVVVHVSPQDVLKFSKIFDNDTYYCPPIEVLRSEIVHKGQFNLLHPDSGLKIDIVIRKDSEFAVSEFKRRLRVPFFANKEVYVASPEDVIIAKLDYFRQGGSEKHLKDIRGILAETEVDHVYLDEWLVKLGLKELWARV